MADEPPDGPVAGIKVIQMAWLEQLRSLQADRDQQSADPFRTKVEAAVHRKDAISTAALLDLLDVAKTTGNARRIATTMRSLGFVPIKSRRLMPGGLRDTVARGWARPVREPTHGLRQGETVRRIKLNPRHALDCQQRGPSHA